MAVKVFYYFWCFWPLLLLVYKSSGAKASIWVTVNIPHVNLLIFTFRCLFMTSSLEIARFFARIFWKYISKTVYLSDLARFSIWFHIMYFIMMARFSKRDFQKFRSSHSQISMKPCSSCSPFFADSGNIYIVKRAISTIARFSIWSHNYNLVKYVAKIYTMK